MSNQLILEDNLKSYLRIIREIKSISDGYEENIKKNIKLIHSEKDIDRCICYIKDVLSALRTALSLTVIE
ncbi:hypothetical protein [Phocoenobacter skyensis]|uniref:Uncharacterized protein n=1 Tax=Phocoenobacter skyensis TaxID=97481 RepID=A0AAJ6P2W9_9PAST|nr:hypothetical protein [Pasteurella skyensis]MDP8175125.1 hypothetical protein [Pasteurella skyensis]